MGVLVMVVSFLFSCIATLKGYYAVERILVAVSLFIFIMQSFFIIVVDNNDQQLRYRLISITISLVTIMCLINTAV